MGHAIVTEKLSDGMATWQENPKDLEDRRSLAKVIRTDCTSAGVSVLSIKAYQMKETRLFGLGPAPPSKCDQYAQIVFSRATGKASNYTSGFVRPRDVHRSSQGKGAKGAGKGSPKKSVNPAVNNYAVVF